MSVESLVKKNARNALSTYASFDIVLDHGRGCELFDINGKRYLDFVAGIAVNILGHGNQGLCQAISKQAEKLIHCSNLYLNETTVNYMEHLLHLSGFDQAFFCNSGTEAIEAALKLSRRWAQEHNKPGRKIIALENSFHGRTMGALSATGQEKYQAPFRPLLQDIRFIDPSRKGSLEASLDDDCIAILLEPIQGEGGVRPLPESFLMEADRLRKEHDLLLIYDEVQCGFGRSGKLFAWEHASVKPDILCMAKAIAGGIPMGGILVQERSAAFRPGDHAATFGGNPLACAAAEFVLSELEGGLIDAARDSGLYLEKKLDGLVERFPIVTERRGIGLMQGIQLSSKSAELIALCIEKGLLLVKAGSDVVRMVPPLVVSREEVDEAVAILAASLESVSISAP